ncbi:SDR family oxidoreductase [Sinorhizobium sp. 7-81]|uniref:SDR family NAD(P)-dependent oxidoreductase n=1 Tax=Sinorhizobium sp. 8-89 TaxID=3049089 RepID=UPI0024C24AE3|nr:SDR family oxidoreductase [Sinorhizobium sp. 8-89]MDK1493705.1 SDR family oxidoreductase [Sinorhizobium sp. 8-89]
MISNPNEPLTHRPLAGFYGRQFDLTGRTAVVTGGGRNIGLACAQALAEAGAKVVITGRSDSDTAERGRDELAHLGYDASVLKFDVTKADEVEKAAEIVADQFGGADILVCNSGAGLGRFPAEDLADEAWMQTLDLNLNGVFRCCRAFGRQMLTKKKGAIINIGSISGEIVNRPQFQSDYNVAKAGVHHLTKCLAAEWADRGVRVNAVAPTYIDKPGRWGKDDDSIFSTWMSSTPMNRQGEPHEIGSVVLFLASDASSLMTGAIVMADGGYTVW